MLRVLDLGMKVYTVEGTVDAGNTFHLARGRRGGEPEPVRDLLDLVVVRSPYDELVGNALEDIRMVGNLQIHLPELRNGSGTNLRAEVLAHKLHTRTYA